MLLLSLSWSLSYDRLVAWQILAANLASDHRLPALYAGIGCGCPESQSMHIAPLLLMLICVYTNPDNSLILFSP